MNNIEFWADGEGNLRNEIPLIPAILHYRESLILTEKTRRIINTFTPNNTEQMLLEYEEVQNTTNFLYKMIKRYLKTSPIINN